MGIYRSYTVTRPLRRVGAVPRNDTNARATRDFACFLFGLYTMALDVVKNFTFAENEKKQDYLAVIENLEEYCTGEQNEVNEGYVLWTRTHDEYEPVGRISHRPPKTSKVLLLCSTLRFDYFRSNSIRQEPQEVT